MKSVDAPTTATRLYVYCIAALDGDRTFECPAIGDGPVHAIVHRDIAAVVSASPAKASYVVSRQNMLAHQTVMEAAMSGGTPLLPVRFDTLAPDEEAIRGRVLVERYDELRSLLRGMEGKAELGIKALWRDMPSIFAEIVAENPEIRRLRDRRSNAVRLGEMVKRALEARKTKEQAALTAQFVGLYEDVRVNKTFGDAMFANTAFLVAAERAGAFDAKVREVAADRVTLKYVGPVPPSNFVEIVIRF